ncbi:MAG: peptidoglycan-binding protein [Candidatus Sungbacteria bacterium]|nr:peptidoglycan-binding protein [Candidatus Sungbacteria bacterium]
MRRAYFFIVLLAILVGFPRNGGAVTSEELQAQIAALLAQIQALQQQLQQLRADDTERWCHTFNKNLGIGSSGDEVQALQTALSKEGVIGQSFEGLYGRPDQSTFDEETAAAVSGFQEKYRSEILNPAGLKFGTGYVGAATRKKLNQLYSCGSVPPPPSSEPTLRVLDSRGNLEATFSLSIRDQNGRAVKLDPLVFPVLPVGEYSFSLSARGSRDAGETVSGVLSVSEGGYKVYNLVSANIPIKDVLSIVALDRSVQIKVSSGSQEESALFTLSQDGRSIPITFKDGHGPSYRLGAGRYTLSVSEVGGVSQEGYNITANSQGYVLQAQRSVVPPVPIPPVSARFSITDFLGLQLTYQVGEKAKFSIKGVEPDGTPGTPEEGFNVQVYIKKTSGDMDPVWLKKTNGQPDANAVFDGRYWVFAATEGIPTSGYYEIDAAFYCNRDDSVCARKYGIAAQVNKYVKFSVGDSVSSVTVFSPNGGETWQVGKTYTVSYKLPSTDDAALVYLERAYPEGSNRTGANSSMLIGEPAQGQQSFSYTVSDSIISWPGLGSNYKIKVCARNSGCNISDSSDAYFSITAANQSSLTVSSLTLIGNQSTYAAGQAIKFSVKGVASDGSVGVPGKGFNVQVWMQRTNPVETVQIGGVYQSFNASYNSSTGYWDVAMTAPSGTSQTYKIETAFYCSNSSLGCSSGQINKSFTFTVSSAAQPSITVLSPNGGEILQTGEMYGIRWTSPGILASENVKIELGYTHTDYSYPGGTYVEDWIVERTPNTGTYLWRVPEEYGTGFKSGVFSVKISTATGVVDYSDRKFSIVMGGTRPSLSVSSPVADAAYKTGDLMLIKWGSLLGEGESVRFSLLRKNDPTYLSWSAISAYYDSTAQSWATRVPSGLADSSDYYVRVAIHKNGIPVRIGYSGVFAISAGEPRSSITVLSPNGGEVWRHGETKTIQWSGVTPDSRYASVNVSLFKANGEFVYTNNVGAPNRGSVQFVVVSSIQPGEYLIEVACATNCITRDRSDAPFTIAAASSSAGKLHIALDSSTPTARTVPAGSTGVVATIFRVSAINEAIQLRQLGLEYSGSNLADVAKYTVWDGALKVAEGIFGTSRTAVAVLSNVTVPKDSDKLLTVKVDLSGTAQMGNAFRINYNGDTENSSSVGVGLLGVGVSSSQFIYSATNYDLFGNSIVVGVPVDSSEAAPQ